MRDADRAGSISRRDFLRRATITAVGASASLVVGEAMWTACEQLGPRRLLVAGIPSMPEIELLVGADGSVLSASLVSYDLVGGAQSLFPKAWSKMPTPLFAQLTKAPAST